MVEGILLNANGCRGEAGVEPGVHGALKDAQGLYNWSTIVVPSFVLRQIPELSKAPGVVGLFVQIAPKSPDRSASVKTEIKPVELGTSKRCP